MKNVDDDDDDGSSNSCKNHREGESRRCSRVEINLFYPLQQQAVMYINISLSTYDKSKDTLQ